MGCRKPRQALWCSLGEAWTSDSIRALSLGLPVERTVWTSISSLRGPGARAMDGLDRKGLKG